MTTAAQGSAYARATQAFTAHFGGLPQVVARAPGRVNLIGDHVDYAEGYALPIAVDMDAVCAARPSTDDRWRVWSEELRSMVELPDPLGASPLVGANERWANLALGVLVAIGREGVLVPPLQLAIASDVPMGAGLASSAAFEGAVATSVADALASPLLGLPLARVCQEAEHAFAGVPCGLMDQVTAALAREGHALLIDCRTLDCRFVPIPPGLAILVADTKVRHDLSDGRYAARRSEVEEAARLLGVRVLRDADETSVRNARLPEPVAARARHVVREIQRTQLAAAALKRGDFELLGMLMYQSHQSLREDFAVSVPELDALVDDARAAGIAHGVYGARMTGGGFGGSAVILAETSRADAVAARLSASFQRRFKHAPGIRAVQAAAGASVFR